MIKRTNIQKQTNAVFVASPKFTEMQHTNQTSSSFLHWGNLILHFYTLCWGSCITAVEDMLGLKSMLLLLSSGGFFFFWPVSL